MQDQTIDTAVKGALSKMDAAAQNLTDAAAFYVIGQGNLWGALGEAVKAGLSKEAIGEAVGKGGADMNTGSISAYYSTIRRIHGAGFGIPASPSKGLSLAKDISLCKRTDSKVPDTATETRQRAAAIRAEEKASAEASAEGSAEGSAEASAEGSASAIRFSEGFEPDRLASVDAEGGRIVDAESLMVAIIRKVGTKRAAALLKQVAAWDEFVTGEGKARTAPVVEQAAA